MTPEILEQIKSMRYIAKENPLEIVNLYAFVYWAEDKLWYRCKIVKYF